VQLRRLVATALLLIVSGGCGSGASDTAPGPPSVAGAWEGETASGQTITWTLQQNGTQITGTGTFGDSGATYALRGGVSYDSLNVRLVGAPGDSGTDSVYYNGRFNYELYAGLAVIGTITAPPGALNGPLTLFQTTPP